MLDILFRVEGDLAGSRRVIDLIRRDTQTARERELVTLRVEGYEDPEAVDTFYVYEDYIDVAAFEAYQRNEPYKEWESKIKPMMKKINSHL